MSSGFVAGTLVHTDKGLVPIQNLKVGDLVLSIPKEAITKEGFQQSLIYQPVTKTFKSQDKKTVMMPLDGASVICTDKATFWANEKWVEAGKLDRNCEAVYSLIFNEEIYYLQPAYFSNRKFHLDNIYLVATQDSQIAIVLETNFSTDSMREMQPTLWKFESNKYQPIMTNDLESYLGMFVAYEKTTINNFEAIILDTIILDKNRDNDAIQYYGKLLEEIVDSGDIYPFQQYAFNIEVENTHNYFVGAETVLTGDSTIQGNNE